MRTQLVNADGEIKVGRGNASKIKSQLQYDLTTWWKLLGNGESNYLLMDDWMTARLVKTMKMRAQLVDVARRNLRLKDEIVAVRRCGNEVTTVGRFYDEGYAGDDTITIFNMKKDQYL